MSLTLCALQLLIQHKAGVNALNHYGSSPLHLASWKGELTCVQILVAAGTKKDTPNSDGYTSLAEAIVHGMHGKPDVAEFLLHSGAKMSNVNLGVKIPDWMTEIITKRHNAMHSTLALKGVLKRRLGIVKDATHLIALYFWSMRLHNV